MLAVLAVLAALVLAAPVAAQCTVRGAVTVERATLHEDVVLPHANLPDVEVAWPPSSSARLRSPFDAPIDVEGVPYRLADGAALPDAFFRGDAPSAAVEQRDGETLLRFGFVEVTGVRLRCRDLGLGVAPGPSSFEPGDEGALGRYSTLEGGVDLRASAWDGARTIHVAGEEGQSIGLAIVTRRRGWLEVERDLSGVVVHGWVRADPERERWGSGAGGFRGRTATVPRRRTLADACYVGPAAFAEAPIVYAHETDPEGWGTLTDGRAVLVRDCGGARIEIVHAIGLDAHFGWIDALDVTRLGRAECSDGLVLLQRPNDRRVLVLEPRGDLERGDEIVSFGGVRFVRESPVLDLLPQVAPVLPDEICASWTRGEALEVRRGEALSFFRRGP